MATVEFERLHPDPVDLAEECGRRVGDVVGTLLGEVIPLEIPLQLGPFLDTRTATDYYTKRFFFKLSNTLHAESRLLPQASIWSRT